MLSVCFWMREEPIWFILLSSSTPHFRGLFSTLCHETLIRPRPEYTQCVIPQGDQRQFNINDNSVQVVWKFVILSILSLLGSKEKVPMDEMNYSINVVLMVNSVPVCIASSKYI